MRDALKFEMDDISKRISDMMERVFKEASPGCIEWWQQQPVDFIQETLNELETAIQTATPRAIDIALSFAESELRMFVRFHARAQKWVESIQIMNLKIELSPRLLPPGKESK